jgi:cytochrome c oxidase subunit 2
VVQNEEAEAMLTGTISSTAQRVDDLNLLLTSVCALVVLIVCGAGAFFIWKYHATKRADRTYSFTSVPMEIAWTSITLLVFLTFFFKGSAVYKDQVKPMKPDYQIFVFAKRWMWKFHHPSGVVEVNHLHLPAHKNIRLTMISEDVIHSFFVPHLRLKQDILPETLTNINFKAERTGEVPLHCAEYCGTFHSRMGGKVTLLKENDYRRLVHLSVAGESLSLKGKKIFEANGCVTCHNEAGKAPVLRGLSDEAYIRESIYYPQKVIAGNYLSAMPSYKNSLSEEQVRALIEYIKEVH